MASAITKHLYQQTGGGIDYLRLLHKPGRRCDKSGNLQDTFNRIEIADGRLQATQPLQNASPSFGS